MSKIVQIKNTLKKVKKWIKKFFSKLFSKKNAENYTQPVLNAAQSNAYVETVSNKADSLHKSIKSLYEEDIQENYLEIMRDISPKFRRDKVRLAIDKHEIGYYGKKDNLHIVGTAYGNKSYKKAFEFIFISLLTGKKEERIHLYAIPWHVGQDLTDSVKILLNVVKKWFNKIEVVQFDRGFNSWELIDWLNKQKIPYLIHKIKHKGKLKELVEQTKSFYCGKYSGKYTKAKSTFCAETNLYICKNVRKKDWLFVSSLKFTKKEQPVLLYRNRWQIETNYSISNQNRIMSKSTHYLIKYFYFLCDIFLQVLWRLCGYCYIQFKNFLRCFVVTMKEIIKMKPLVFEPPQKKKDYSFLLANLFY